MVDAVEMVGADALAVHLNVVQELVQPEGDRVVDGLLGGVADAVAASPVPVVAKETGAGMDRQGAAALVAAGVAALDVGGLGGTSFARVERDRAAAAGHEHAARLGEVFADWGIPTASSVLETRTLGVPVIATGGVRSGLDAARALALGATVVGIGRPAVEAALRGTAAVRSRGSALLRRGSSTSCAPPWCWPAPRGPTALTTPVPLGVHPRPSGPAQPVALDLSASRGPVQAYRLRRTRPGDPLGDQAGALSHAEHGGSGLVGVGAEAHQHGAGARVDLHDLVPEAPRPVDVGRRPRHDLAPRRGRVGGLRGRRDAPWRRPARPSWFSHHR